MSKVIHHCDKCNRDYTNETLCPHCGNKGRVSQIYYTKEKVNIKENNSSTKGMILS